LPTLSHSVFFPRAAQTRTSTDPEDVQQMALHMEDKNRQAGQDLDRIFMQRKQREQETAQVRTAMCHTRLTATFV
jgi:hypothetical protein